MDTIQIFPVSIEWILQNTFLFGEPLISTEYHYLTQTCNKRIVSRKPHRGAIENSSIFKTPFWVHFADRRLWVAKRKVFWKAPRH
jgi:hypothetical protein